MSRDRAYTRNQRAKTIRRKRKLAFDSFNQGMYPHLGCYDKGKIRIWRCARDRYERLPDKREAIAMIRLEEEKQVYEIEKITKIT